MPSAQPSEIPYADASAIVARALLEALSERDPLDVPDWTRHNRMVRGGRWRHENAPYLVGPMAALSDPRIRTVVLVGPGQCGKTEVPLNWLGAAIDNRETDRFLWYLHTDEALKNFVRTRIDGQLLPDHRSIRARLTHDTLAFKRFGALTVSFATATASTLISREGPYIVCDEPDNYDPELGDILSKVNLRRQSYPHSKVLLLSHCDRARGSDPAAWVGIAGYWAAGDRHEWYWPCASCGAWSSPNPTASRVMALHYDPEQTPEDIQTHARMLCPVNGCLLDDAQRLRMIRLGRWIARGQRIDQDGTITGEATPTDTASFWVVGLMSPFAYNGLGGLARALAEAERKAASDGDEKTLIEVTTKQIGVPYVPKTGIGAIALTALADRVEPSFALGTVPAGVRFLTAFADVQSNRFELLVRGWGRDGESWIVDWRAIAADTATDPDDWDRMIATLGGSYPLADGSGRHMRIRGAAYDSGGADGVTDQAYSAWTRAKRRHQIRLLGRDAAGRERWSVLPAKGNGARQARTLMVTRPDSSRNDRRARAAGEVPVMLMGTNQFKDALNGHLMVADPGAGYVHFPAAFLSKGDRPHGFFAQLLAEARDPKTGVWKRTGGPNEALDCMAGCHAVAHLNGLRRLDWDNPPIWAETWERNSMIVDAPVIVAPAEVKAAPVSRKSVLAVLA